jgi:hypothetical protein
MNSTVVQIINARFFRASLRPSYYSLTPQVAASLSASLIHDSSPVTIAIASSESCNRPDYTLLAAVAAGASHVVVARQHLRHTG